MSLDSPDISVILPVNRDDGFMDDAINSILGQSYSSFELIIVANNCSDVLWRKLLSYKDDRIMLFRIAIGQLPHALNFGIEKSRGKYIARMDADDISHINRFSTQVKFLKAFPVIDIVGSNYKIIDQNGVEIKRKAAIKLSNDLIQRNLIWSTCLAHPTVMFRKDRLIKIGGYAYGMYAEDWDLYLRMRRANYSFANLEQKLLSYRVHTNQSTSFNNKKRNDAYVVSLLIREFLYTKNFLFLLSALKYLIFSFLSSIKMKIQTKGDLNV